MTTAAANLIYKKEKSAARLRGFPHSVTVAGIERQLGLKPKQLAQYRESPRIYRSEKG